jgi:hypothetical protein
LSGYDFDSVEITHLQAVTTANAGNQIILKSIHDLVGALTDTVGVYADQDVRTIKSHTSALRIPVTNSESPC